MHILRNTGKRIFFHIYDILFGETSLCKDNKIVNFIILYSYKTKHLFMFETKKNTNLAWAYTLFEV